MQLNNILENEIKSSITLKLNSKANELKQAGQAVINLTAGQLPFKPDTQLIQNISNSLDLIESFQYSPVGGFKSLTSKLISYVEKTRNLDLSDKECIVSNGGKHSLFVLLSAMINPGDEVILLAPYWLSYPAMVKLAGGNVKIVESTIFNNFEPQIEDIEKQINSKTKAIIINSPNNPSGVTYSETWMKNFSELLVNHEDVWIYSDEIYYELNYFDPKPTYFYQFAPELLNRTLIFDGISKSMAATGLRLGYCIGPKNVIELASRFQSHTASGINSLIQKAVEAYNFSELEKFMINVKNHLRENSETLKNVFLANDLSSSWYQTTGAFYFIIDFSTTPCFQKFDDGNGTDQAFNICERLLEEYGVVVVPTSDFGLKNCARISLVSESAEFSSAMEKIIKFLNTSL